jgi:plastocyanin
VRDRSTQHNFHLASNQDGSVDFRTELEFVGEQDFTVTFKDRTRYAYACEPHYSGSSSATGRHATTSASPAAG